MSIVDLFFSFLQKFKTPLQKQKFKNSKHHPLGKKILDIDVFVLYKILISEGVFDFGRDRTPAI